MGNKIIASILIALVSACINKPFVREATYCVPDIKFNDAYTNLNEASCTEYDIKVNPFDERSTVSNCISQPNNLVSLRIFPVRESEKSKNPILQGLIEFQIADYQKLIRLYSTRTSPLNFITEYSSYGDRLKLKSVRDLKSFELSYEVDPSNPIIAKELSGLYLCETVDNKIEQ